jgi:excisionase family DNA binding protein
MFLEARPNDAKHEGLVDVRTAATMLGLTESCLRAWIAQRRIGFVRLGRAVRVPVEEVNRIVQAGFVPAQAAAVTRKRSTTGLDRRE